MDVPMHPAHLPLPVMPQVPPQQMLLGQKAIVTGASSGIGRAIALALGQAGADVAVNYITDPDKAEQTCADIRGFGVRAIAVRADVSDEAEAKDMFRRTIEAFGTVFGEKPLGAVSPAWRCNDTTLELQEAYGLAYAGDCRGFAPFYPIVKGQVQKTLQIPTTLPTLDELHAPADWLRRVPGRRG